MKERLTMRVRQIDNALNLLELYARAREPMTLTAMARALRMPKSSVFNLIETLVGRGLLYEVSPRGGHYPTRRLLDLSRAIMDGDLLLQRIRGELEVLAARTGETVVLSAREHNDVVYVEVVESAAPIRYFAKVGEHRAIHTTSSGKAILTTYEPLERGRILRSLRYVAHQKATKRNAQELAADLEAAIRRGWCEDRAESTADVMGLGAPIFTGERRFGLGLAGPLFRMEDNRDALVRCLIATADRVKEIATTIPSVPRRVNHN
jgi:DNA-binding IclR family transcriptional regulator